MPLINQGDESIHRLQSRLHVALEGLKQHLREEPSSLVSSPRDAAETRRRLRETFRALEAAQTSEQLLQSEVAELRQAVETTKAALARKHHQLEILRSSLAQEMDEATRELRQTVVSLETSLAQLSAEIDRKSGELAIADRRHQAELESRDFRIKEIENLNERLALQVRNLRADLEQRDRKISELVKKTQTRPTIASTLKESSPPVKFQLTTPPPARNSQTPSLSSKANSPTSTSVLGRPVDAAVNVSQPQPHSAPQSVQATQPQSAPVIQQQPQPQPPKAVKQQPQPPKAVNQPTPQTPPKVVTQPATHSGSMMHGTFVWPQFTGLTGNRQPMMVPTPTLIETPMFARVEEPVYAAPSMASFAMRRLPSSFPQTSPIAGLPSHHMH